MWRYNNTNNLPGDSLYHSADELYHYGVLGMRWGHRRNPEVRAAHKEYKQSKWGYRKAAVKNLKNAFKKSSWTAGVDNAKAYKKNHKELFTARDKREKAAFKLIDAAAKDSYEKTLAKTGSKEKATKASMKTHYKAFKQGKFDAGRVGSVADANGGQKRFYNHMVKTQGKKYADAVEKKYNNYTTKALAASVVALGASIYANYKLNKY